ncbi:TetR/AcrR family transcriptional regulator [Ornithinimicrobium cerasi]|uniref:TetR/AcrR family transcriptional regulator n=1 Tax=Ornithinimicrobium cerasi TaxID=2248773 RepID=UPI001379BCE2|nr:TetR/AcrR family transcriptional regulator [Ornithinimicrobium cerasi]
MTPPVTIPLRPGATPSGTGRDGRDVRWEAHRTKRRRQLVESALKAIRKHGAGVGMDEIAASAGTSKTVLYRHLGDRAGLYRAVVTAVDERILEEFTAAEAVVGERDTVERIAAMVRAYLSMVEKDPEIYRFVMTRPLETTQGEDHDPVHQITDRIAGRLTQALREHLVATGREDAAVLAPVWGTGIVGLVQSAAEHWLSSRRTEDSPLTPDAVTDAVVSLIRPALTEGRR